MHLIKANRNRPQRERSRLGAHRQATDRPLRKDELGELPTKLHRDAIAEALCEIKFDCDEAKSLPEYVVGRLASHTEWRNFKKKRLPVSDIPIPVRQQDPNLRFQPHVELNHPNLPLLVKIGVSVLSVHRLDPYPGWEKFVQEIDSAVDYLFESLTEVKINRIGLRYINLFNAEDHLVTGLSSLDAKVKVAGSNVEEGVNLNFKVGDNPEFSTLVRLATPDFVAPSTRRSFTFLADIDVGTVASSIHTPDECKRLVEAAHREEKRNFFALFTQEMLAHLRR